MRVGAIVVASAALASALPAAATEVPHVLVYSRTEGFRHLSIAHAKSVLAREAATSGAFTLEFTEDVGSISAKTLRRTDAVVWLSSTGSASPFSEEQERAYVEWMRCGGGHVGIHASTDSWTDWDEWVEVTGAFIAGHPLTAGSIGDEPFQDPDGAVDLGHTAFEHGIVEGSQEPEATINVAARRHPTTAPWKGQGRFDHHDEYYYFDRNPADVMTDFEPLLTFGGFTNPAEAAMWGSRYPEDMPVAWAGSYHGRNRTFYTNLGHGIDTWNWQPFVDHVVAGIAWTIDARTPTGCRT